MLPLFLHVALGENLDPLDLAVVALWHRALHEGTVMEHMVCRRSVRLFAVLVHG